MSEQDSTAAEEQAVENEASSGADGAADGLAASDGAAGGGDTSFAPAETRSGGVDELSTMRDRHLRLAAEFDNYRKRVERERSENMVRAQAQILERLLEPLDDLARIADFDPATTAAGALHEGAEMVEKKFMRVMEAAGLEAIDAEGKPFDPTVHEALTTVPADTPEEDNTVAQVYQKGYRYKGVLLRPARVVVKKHPG
ncbi:MAG TPA: nucleotide exchange factor GrpE [Longimicrobium sp.]|jgi:molecular chaperone GrpE|uniref:nucleotide exchange factor GrpE n=1 Tax=Longimicrobium sp. TaxID=2029185 RepID=UPI002EDB7B3C